MEGGVLASGRFGGMVAVFAMSAVERDRKQKIPTSKMHWTLVPRASDLRVTVKMKKPSRKQMVAVLAIFVLLGFERYSTWVRATARAEEMIEDCFARVHDPEAQIRIESSAAFIPADGSAVAISYAIECATTELTLHAPCLVPYVVTYDPLFGRSFSGSTGGENHLLDAPDTMTVAPGEPGRGTVTVTFGAAFPTEHTKAKVVVALIDHANEPPHEAIVSNVLTMRIR